MSTRFEEKNDAASITNVETTPDSTPPGAGKRPKNAQEELLHVLSEIGITPEGEEYIMRIIGTHNIIDFIALPDTTWEEATDNGHLTPVESNKILLFKKWIDDYLMSNPNLPSDWGVEFNAGIFRIFTVMQSVKKPTRPTQPTSNATSVPMELFQDTLIHEEDVMSRVDMLSTSDATSTTTSYVKTYNAKLSLTDCPNTGCTQSGATSMSGTKTKARS